MKKQQFKTTIKAARNIVWYALWNEKNYRVWTSAFTEGSHAVSNWNEGSEILFLDLNGNGMYAVIEKKEEPAFMCFKHMGEIKNNEKQE
ncbi:MAG: SRPBCC domain-containing protein, partial [Sphingobacteriales bacterium]